MYEFIFSAGATFSGAKKCLQKMSRRQTEPEKAPLEEVKDEVVEIGESAVDGEQAGENEDVGKKG